MMVRTLFIGSRGYTSCNDHTTRNHFFFKWALIYIHTPVMSRIGTVVIIYMYMYIYIYIYIYIIGLEQLHLQWLTYKKNRIYEDMKKNADKQNESIDSKSWILTMLTAILIIIEGHEMAFNGFWYQFTTGKQLKNLKRSLNYYENSSIDYYYYPNELCYQHVPTLIMHGAQFCDVKI